MAFKIHSRVWETTSIVGTGDLTLAGAQDGYAPFSEYFSDGDTTFVLVALGSDYEVFLGTYNASANSISRTTIYESTNGDAAVSWGAGDKQILVANIAPSDMDASGLASYRALLGLAIGTDVQAYDADLDTYAANPLAATELAELQNIGSTTISAAQWGYLGAMGGQPLESSDIGSSVQAQSADLDTYDANPLTATELQQLQNIGASAISAAEWGYLAGLDQALASSDSPAFAGLEVNGNLAVAANIQHVGDLNNEITFGTDTQDFRTGNASRIDLSDSGVRLGGANARVTTVLDEDAMGSNSATALATQQSIKAYVDAATPAASTSAAGLSELATAAEVTTGTDATRAVTPDGLAGSDYGKAMIPIIVFSDADDVATGDGAGDVFVSVPSELNGWDLVGVAAHVQTAGTTGTTDIQVHNVTQAADMLSTKLTIDSGEKDSDTAATPAVIDAANDDVATGDELRIDVDAVQTTAPKGLLVWLIFRNP